MKRLPVSGESFGRYRLTRKLGQGGMGVVYAAVDTTLDREVAVKLVNPQYADDPDFRTRFSFEAATLARLESARIVRIYDHGEADGVLYIVTQFIDGPDLLQLVRTDGPMAPGEALAVLAQVAEGLQDAHEVGVVHRDIKPANVLLRQRGGSLEAFLCDFGIAAQQGVDLSRTGTVAGSLPYMAPERHSGQAAGVPGDIYAMGCMLWHALSGAAPYAGTDVEVAMGHIEGPIPQLRGRGAFTASVNQLLRRTMAKDPAKRPASAALLHRELLELAAAAPDAVTLPEMTSIRHGLVAARPGHRFAWKQAVLASAAVATLLLGTVWAGGALTGEGGPDWLGVTSRDGLRGGDDATGNDDVLGQDATSGLLWLDWAGDPTTAGGTPSDGAPRSDAVPPAGGSVAPGTGSPAPDLPAVTSRPPATTAAPPPPPPPPPETTAPLSRYVCWNGTAADSLSECSNPTGLTGARWVFGGIRDLDCSRRNLRWTDREKEAFVCPLGNGNYAYVARWGSANVARNQLEKHLSTGSSEWTPYANNIVYGRKLTKNQEAGKKQFAARIIQGSVVWSVQITANNRDARTRGLQTVRPWRNPAYLRGRPR